MNVFPKGHLPKIIVITAFVLSIFFVFLGQTIAQDLPDDLFSDIVSTNKKTVKKEKSEKKKVEKKTKKKNTSKVKKKEVSIIPEHPWTDDELYTVKAQKDSQGWKILINDKPFFVKGIVWGESPIGTTYSYGLFSDTEKQIKNVIDLDMTQLKKAGINAIRCFETIPPKWVYYIYKKYGIYTIINDMMGRYGLMYKGKWVFPVNYSDPGIRKTLIEQEKQVVLKYKNVPGVLFFFYGNESNYGLEWKSTDIENLPVGERNKAKAKYLYSLFEEVLKQTKQLDSRHLAGIVNGDLQYLDLIKTECPSLDILGANVYRGKSATDLFSRVKKELGKPFVFTEFGCDAYNVKTEEEDQYDQAYFLKLQWQEIYHKSYGKGEEQNCIGGFTFSYADGWWKYKQVEDIDVHNTEGSWANQGYPFDYVPGKNNMNEEWWGIVALSPRLQNGINIRIPRAAYYLLSDVFKLNPFEENTKSIDAYFNTLKLPLYVSMGEMNVLKSDVHDIKTVRLVGGSIMSEMDDSINSATSNLNFSKGLMANLDFAFNPFPDLKGTLRLNVVASAPDRVIEQFYYGDRIKPIKVILGTNKGTIIKKTGVKSINPKTVEIYSASFKYTNPYGDIEGFYHIPRGGWRYTGDFFGLYPDTYDMYSQDIWNTKAPSGMEFIGKKALNGLDIVVGPEVYWGANPKIMAKYMKNLGPVDFALIHSEDVAQQNNVSQGLTSGAVPTTRKTSLYLKLNFLRFMSAELGGLWGSPEKIGQTFTRVVKSSGQGYLGSGYDVVQNDSIKILDTLGFRALFKGNIASKFGWWAGFDLDGLVAEPGYIPPEQGSLIGSGGAGNNMEYRGGLQGFFGKIQVAVNYVNRKPLVGPNPIIEGFASTNGVYPGVGPRNILDDPFAVLGNREAQIYEMILTFEPTGATWFYDWNNDETEDAKLAFNLVFNYADYPTITDSYTYVNETGDTVAVGFGLPAAKVWTASSRIVSNPSKNFKIIASLQAGQQQSTGGSTNMVQFYGLTLKTKYKRLLVDGFVKKDAWGMYDFYRVWNLTYPWQTKLDVSYNMNKISFLNATSRIGLKTYFNVIGEDSPEYVNMASVDNKCLLESMLYYEILF